MRRDRNGAREKWKQEGRVALGKARQKTAYEDRKGGEEQVLGRIWRGCEGSELIYIHRR